MKKSERIFIDRKLLSLDVYKGMCCAIYRVTYGRKRKGVFETFYEIERGRPVRIVPSLEYLNTKKPTKKQKEKFSLEFRPDLADVMLATHTLMRSLTEAVTKLDEFHGVKTN